MALRAAYVLFALSFAANLWLALRDPQWLAIPAVLAGWYLADLASGMVHMFMDYHPCPKGKGLDRLYFYQDSMASQEYQTLFRATMKTINLFQRLVYDFINHYPRPNALGRWRSETHTSELHSLTRNSFYLLSFTKNITPYRISR